jgi:hypothetical protein
VTFCYTTKPKITQAEFPFSITYEYKGETNTLSGVFECEYSGSNTIHGEHDRYWMGESKYDNPDNMEDVQLMDITGRVVYKASDVETMIDLSDLTAGTYILTAFDGEHYISTKIIKK